MEIPEGSQKRVDDAWKAQVEKEKQGTAPPRGPSPARQPQGSRREEAGSVDFKSFVSSLSMQAMMCLGEVPHPANGTLAVDLEQAKNLIDILGMLHEKTRGNLKPDEESMLSGLLYELRMKFVEKGSGR